MNRLKGLLYGAFLGDSFALAPHWIYNTDKIQEQFGVVDGILAPPPTSFHKTKEKGDFTHYGDQSLLILKSLSEMRSFSLEKLKNDWISYMTNYQGYKDHATKESLALLSTSLNFGSISDELGGFSVMAPLLVKYHDDPHLKEHILNAVKLTHNNDLLIGMVSFFTDVIVKVLDGMKPCDAFKEVFPKSGHDIQSYYHFVIQNAHQTSLKFIRDNGQSCHARDAFPATLFLSLKHEDNFRAAMQENVMAGGDSAARGMILGMILGAYLGYDALPSDWLKDLNHLDKIDAYAKLILPTD